MASAATGLCSCILLPLPMPTTRVPPSAPSHSFPVHCHRADSEPIGARSAQKNMLCAVIPAAFPPVPQKGHITLFPQPNRICFAMHALGPLLGFLAPLTHLGKSVPFSHTSPLLSPHHSLHCVQTYQISKLWLKQGHF